MAQDDVVFWLVNRRRESPASGYCAADVARGVGGDPANVHRQLLQLVKHELVETVEGDRLRQVCYRVTDEVFERVTGISINEVDV